MKVVINATPLIALSLINQLELLNELFDEVLVPPEVYQEVVIQGAGQPGAAELALLNQGMLDAVRGILPCLR